MANDHHHHFDKPKDPPKPTIVMVVGLVLAVIGFGVFAWKAFAGDAHDARVAWNGYLIGFWFTLNFALAGPFIIATQNLALAGWSTSLRRIWEAYAAYIPVGFIFAVVFVLFGADHLYEWLSPEAAYDALIQKKAGFLNRTWLVAAPIGSFIVWSIVTFIMRRTSLKQDEEGGEKAAVLNKSISTIYLIVFVIGYSLLSWLFMMSLEPHWFSTMYQVYMFAGLFQSSLALTVLIVLYMNKKGTFGSALGMRQIHDLGQLLFGFTVFYMYIAFSQFMLIWYANIPEEDIFFVTRGLSVNVHTGWEIPSIILPLLKFLIPFFLLLPQDHKKNKWGILTFCASLILFMQLYEIWWVVAPVPTHHDQFAAPFHWPIIELLIALGFTGLFAAVTSFAFSRHPVIPVKDPFIHEAPFHHHTGIKAPEPDHMKIS